MADPGAAAGEREDDGGAWLDGSVEGMTGLRGWQG